MGAPAVASIIGLAMPLLALPAYERHWTEIHRAIFFTVVAARAAVHLLSAAAGGGRPWLQYGPQQHLLMDSTLFAVHQVPWVLRGSSGDKGDEEIRRNQLSEGPGRGGGGHPAGSALCRYIAGTSSRTTAIRSNRCRLAS